MFGLAMFRHRIRLIDKAERKRAHLRYEALSGIIDDRLDRYDPRPIEPLFDAARRALAVAYSPRRA